MIAIQFNGEQRALMTATASFFCYFCYGQAITIWLNSTIFCIISGDCDFETSLCGWMNAANGKEDSFDWARSKGLALPVNMSLTIDHSTGSNKGSGSTYLLVHAVRLVLRQTCFYCCYVSMVTLDMDVWLAWF